MNSVTVIYSRLTSDAIFFAGAGTGWPHVALKRAT